jgi:PLP dependent protein
MPESSIAARLQQVRDRIQAAAVRAGRNPAEVQLVAVSKGHSAESVREALTAGQQLFGENYLAEAVSKMEAIRGGAVWHMLGHVQSRKAAAVADRFAAVHSVDSLSLAERLSRHAEEIGRRLPCFIECNVSGEPGKFGFSAADPERWPDLFPVWENILALSGLQACGLMTMAPYAADPRMTRLIFRRLRALRDAARESPGCVALAGLSMGMSDDFEEAVEEGATLVRIGRAIFGSRPSPFSG